MSDLASQTPANTYKGLLQVNDYTNGVDASAKYIQDGEGTDSALAVSTTAVGIGTASPSVTLDVNGPAQFSGRVLASGAGSGNGYQFIGDGDSGMYQDSFNQIQFSTGGAEKMRIDSSGNVGIGTISPSAPLEVASTTGGVIMPRMTTTEMNAISSPTDGEMIYNTTANKFYGRASGSWVALH